MSDVTSDCSTLRCHAHCCFSLSTQGRPEEASKSRLGCHTFVAVLPAFVAVLQAFVAVLPALLPSPSPERSG